MLERSALAMESVEAPGIRKAAESVNVKTIIKDPTAETAPITTTVYQKSVYVHGVLPLVW